MKISSIEYMKLTKNNLQLSVKDFCLLIGISTRAYFSYTSGQNPIPESIVKLLKCLNYLGTLTKIYQVLNIKEIQQ